MIILSKNKIHKKNKGFTLVELLVTISMFVIITGVVLVNSNKFNGTVLFNNFSYDVALTIKQAQSYGVNVKENIQSNFNYGYGVYFDTTESPFNFVLFTDFYRSSSTGTVLSCDITSECIQKYSMTKGTYIQYMCTGSDDTSCNSNHVNRLSIVFLRPNLDANIYSFPGGVVSSPQAYAKIVLSSENGAATSTVVVTSVGQIYIKKQ